MEFNENSQMVKSMIILLTAGIITDIEEIPDLGNLREAVQSVLTK